MAHGKKVLGFLAAIVMSLGVTACSSGDNSSDGENYVLAYGVEPQNKLIPSNTNEVGGGRLVDLLYSGLTYYDKDGNTHNEMAESIEPEGDTKYKVTLKDDIKFSDGTPVKADNFVNAWNKGMEESHLSAYFYEPIKGFEEGKDKMEGLTVQDDKTFTIELNQPEADFPTRLGYSAFFPLKDEALDDLDGFGEKPIGNGPYKLESWNHNQDALLVPNPEYKGDREAKNDGIKFVFYAQVDAAYNDLLAGNLDVLETVPESAFTTFENELGDRAVNKPSAIFQSFTIPERAKHFSGEEGKLRRQALSLAINRDEITDVIFQGTRTPAKDFSSPVLPGYDENIKGNEILSYDAEKAKKLWADADKIAPFTGEFKLSYNADGGHQAWVDATVNSISNTLGIKAVGNPYPDFKSFRDDITQGKIDGAFRTGWQADYPSEGNFLEPLYATGGGSNDGKYSNKDFDAKLKEAAGSDSPEEAAKIYNEAQEILMQDLPAIPTWYANTTGGSSDKVEDVVFSWKEQPLYYQITKK
ncbi:peptide ABC transporter substrate-binding protein [Corynebacterium ulceribovis]|uniref:peptide ABC transporter substrate-binding protein n=1 Tax=Corynebacterium ulceribovis TaxID=487732 RepID=UPI00037C4C82|nr:ABC transporter substrate-binding protein [Corynebacterium ulceribovis]